MPATGGLPTHADVLAQVDLAVISTDADGIVTTWNPRAERLYGWTREEAIGRPIMERTVPVEAGSQAAEILEQVAGGHSWQGRFRVRRKDGSVVTAFVRSSPMLDGDGS